MDKRYQVFVSSTYADLAEERRRVMQTIIELDCIPAGMELFPAADEDQFEFIKRIIDDCDYYLLIIGGRYGSTTADGFSYTEKEYDYAVERGLKVIALIHENPDAIPLGKSEKDPVLRERLQRFRNKVKDGRLVRFWTSAEQLPGLVSLSLSKTIKMFPAVGWIRANRVASEEILGEVNALRKENEKLKLSISTLQAEARPAIRDIAGLDEQFSLEGKFFYGSSGLSIWNVRVTWADIFAALGPYLYEHPNDDHVKAVLAEAMFAKSGCDGRSPSLDDQLFKTVTLQLRTLGLVETRYSPTTKGGMALFWSLTPKGERQLLESRVVRTPPKATTGR